MTDSLITYEREGDIALIGINRPEKRNAQTQDMFGLLGAAATRAGNEGARAGVIFGHGDTFSAGLDLVATAQDLAQRTPQELERMKRLRSAAHAGYDQIGRGQIPFVCAIQGACIGAGFELACVAHVRVAEENAYFGLPEALRGIFLGGGGTVNIQRIAGYATMADMILTRRMLSAQDAERRGIVQYVTPPGGALEKAKDVARTMAENAPMSNWAAINLLPRIGDLSHDDGLFVEYVGANFTIGAESLQRLNAFANKTAERFKPQD
ncbi:enoyl-CoA hydratase/carnithine racemase [Novosphingobium sp. 1529]|uniref:crotonase/enoyl-CoA hydratase family protein n=1 Tax=Novosphingobium sp. 1529 TaxID=3156424 RepID=UPI00149466AF